jgi:two-component system nitrogen regulation sensor histidine kinase NtrY
VLVVAKDDSVPVLPAVSLELLRKAIVQRDNSSTIQAFSDGNIIRAVMPAQATRSRGAIVVSSFIPFSFISRMDDITAAHEEFRNLNPLQYPLKSIYLVILVLMTLVILLCATWFGFHLARQLSGPLEMLGLATRRVSDGDYRPVDLESGSAEINHLVGNFNQMTANLDRSQREVLEANRNLTQTLETLDGHSRYIQVVLANVTTGVLSVDANGRITTLNRHGEQLLGLRAADCVGRLSREVLEKSLVETFESLSLELRAERKLTLQRETVVEIRGHLVPLMVSVSSINDERGQQWGRVMVFDDLTMLVNAQRAAAWTEVARRIAHEIKNPLTPIKLSAQRLEKRFGSQIQDPAFKSSVQMIIQQTDDLKRLVNEFSNFARLPQARPVLSSLSKIVDESVEIYRSAQAEISFSVEHDAGLPAFRFDPDQIRRVLINLIDNAVEALRGQRHGRVLVKTQFDASLKLVRISVIDNGSGIPDSDREKVFEPYFSTKESGTGLGLAIVRRIIEDHNGFVRAIGNEPRGTKVLVELPVLELESVKGPGSVSLQVVGIDFLEGSKGRDLT